MGGSIGAGTAARLADDGGIGIGAARLGSCAKAELTERAASAQREMGSLAMGVSFR